MSFEDQKWTEIVDFLNAASVSLVVAPLAFPNGDYRVVNYNLYWRGLSDWDAVVVHKGQLRLIDPSLLLHLSEEYQATFANEVFVVYLRRRVTAPAFNPQHLAPLSDYCHALRNHGIAADTTLAIATCYVHIPKTGGTTLFNALLSTHLHGIYCESNTHFRLRRELPMSADLIGGHVFLGLMEQAFPGKRQMIVTLREPIARLVSAFASARGKKPADRTRHPPLQTAMRIMSMEDFLATSLGIGCFTRQSLFLGMPKSDFSRWPYDEETVAGSLPLTYLARHERAMEVINRPEITVIASPDITAFVEKIVPPGLDEAPTAQRKNVTADKATLVPDDEVAKIERLLPRGILEAERALYDAAAERSKECLQRLPQATSVPIST